VIIRNMENRSQDNVPLTELSTYIKQLK